MKNKSVKYMVRLLIMLSVTIGTIVLLVTQPVFADKRYQKTLAKPNVLHNHVEILSTSLPANTPIAELLDKKAQYIFDQVSQWTGNVKEQKFDVMGDEYKNIVVNVTGELNKTIVIGAHYDTYDNLPGADDNSSGVAGLIELVRIFSQNKPKYNLQLVFFTTEEPPYFRSELMGSYVHAKSLKDSGVEVEMMLSLEMIGYFDDRVGSQDYPAKGMASLYSDKGDFISIVGNLSQIPLVRNLKSAMRSATSLPVYSINAPAFVAGIDYSDHLNYWQFGFPAVMITDTAFNRNKNYHTAEDTAQKLDYKRMAQVVDAVYYAIFKPQGMN
jgi:Zn-dependent M28 family amino/carboxypeptidase